MAMEFLPEDRHGSESAPLTERQLEVLGVAARGLSNKQIAASLAISPATVKAHIAGIIERLGVKNRTEAAAWFERRQARDGAAAPHPPAATDRGPSLMVAPFATHGDAALEPVANAIVEDLTVMLARLDGLRVMASSSAFAYARESVGMQAATADLVISGSLYRRGAGLDLALALRDGDSAEHYWGQRLSWPRRQVFELLNDAMDGLCAVLLPQLAEAQRRRALLKAAARERAWFWYQQALNTFEHGGLSDVSTRFVQHCLDRALQFDGDYPYARAYRALVGVALARHACPEWQTPTVETIVEDVDRALAVAPEDASVLYSWGATLSFLSTPAQAVAVLRRVVARAPSHAAAYARLGMDLLRCSDDDDTCVAIERAIGLSPRDRRLPLWHFFLAAGHFGGGDIEAMDRAAAAATHNNDFFGPAWAVRAAARQLLGDRAGARRAIGRLRGFDPSWDRERVGGLLERMLWQDGSRCEPLVAAMRDAGL